MSKAQKRSTAHIFIICLAISISIILLLSAVTTAILMTLKDPTGRIGIFSPITLLLSALIGGIICAKMKPGDGMGFPPIVALSVCLIMLILGMIISGGHLGGGAFLNYLCYFAGYTLISYVGGDRRGKKRGRFKHRA